MNKQKLKGFNGKLVSIGIADLIFFSLALTSGWRIYWLFFIFITFFVCFLYLYLIVCTLGLKISHRLISYVITRGDSTELEITVCNRLHTVVPLLSIYIINTQYQVYNTIQQIDISCKGKGITKQRVIVDGEFKGEYHLGVIKYTVCDFFGITHISAYQKIKTDSEGVLSVLPQVHNVDGLAIDRDMCVKNQNVGKVNNSHSNPEISEMRKYAYGDPLKNINWKLSMRMGELYVKQYEEHFESDISVVVNTSIVTDRVLEQHISELTASLINLCLENGAFVNLYVGSTLVARCEDRSDFAKLQKKLARVNITKETSFDEISGKSDIETGKIYILDGTMEIAHEGNNDLYIFVGYRETLNALSENNSFDEQIYKIAVEDGISITSDEESNG